MFKTFPLALLASTPLLASTCCMPLEDPNCYSYAVNPPVSSAPCCNFGGRIDFLYWKPYSDDNSFASVINSGAFGTFTGVGTLRSSSLSVNQVDLKYDWQAGFRVGVDVGYPCNEWRVSFDWTHYLNHNPKAYANTGNVTSGANSQSQIGPNQVVILSYLQDPSFYAPFSNSSTTPPTVFDSSANGQWKVDYNTLDLLFQRQFYVGHKVTLAPYAGLKALFLKQTLHSFAETSYQFTVLDSAFSHNVATNMNADLWSEFKGVGVEIGLETTWDVICNLGFYGDISSSILYGNSKSKLTGSLNSNVPPSDALLATPYLVDYFAERKVNNLKATLDLAFGIEWSGELNSWASNFAVRAGWEEHLLFRQNTFIEMDMTYETLKVVTSNVKQRMTDVSFQGLVVTALLQY